MNKILNIFFLILSINTNIYASKPQTHFDLRNIMKDASFSYYEGNKVLNNNIEEKWNTNINNNKEIVNQYSPCIKTCEIHLLKPQKDIKENNLTNLDKLQYNTTLLTNNQNENMSSKDIEKTSKIKKDKIKYGAINILKLAVFTNKDQDTKTNKTNFNIISQDKSDIPEEKHENYVFTNIDGKEVTEAQIYTKYGMSNINLNSNPARLQKNSFVESNLFFKNCDANDIQIQKGRQYIEECLKKCMSDTNSILNDINKLSTNDKQEIKNCFEKYKKISNNSDKILNDMEKLGAKLGEEDNKELINIDSKNAIDFMSELNNKYIQFMKNILFASYELGKIDSIVNLGNKKAEILDLAKNKTLKNTATDKRRIILQNYYELIDKKCWPKIHFISNDKVDYILNSLKSLNEHESKQEDEKEEYNKTNGENQK